MNNRFQKKLENFEEEDQRRRSGSDQKTDSCDETDVKPFQKSSDNLKGVPLFSKDNMKNLVYNILSHSETETRQRDMKQPKKNNKKFNDSVSKIFPNIVNNSLE